jgi:hypothetical protein
VTEEIGNINKGGEVNIGAARRIKFFLLSFAKDYNII